jgi:hypothetical protein
MAEPPGVRRRPAALLLVRGLVLDRQRGSQTLSLGGGAAMNQCTMHAARSSRIKAADGHGQCAEFTGVYITIFFLPLPNPGERSNPMLSTVW